MYRWSPERCKREAEETSRELSRLVTYPYRVWPLVADGRIPKPSRDIPQGLSA